MSKFIHHPMFLPVAAAFFLLSGLIHLFGSISFFGLVTSVFCIYVTATDLKRWYGDKPQKPLDLAPNDSFDLRHGLDGVRSTSIMAR